MATIYDVLELSTAVKPWLLRHLLEYDDVVCFLDPDIEVFTLARADRSTRASARNRAHSTHHDPAAARRSGAEREDDPAGRGLQPRLHRGARASPGAFLSWWSERLRRECRIAFEDGLFVDQRWIDFVPSYFDHTVLLDQGYNVAYWNLYERELKLGANGYEVNGGPLRFFHYSGFNPLRPYVLSKYQAGELRIRLEDQFAAAQLCARYASRLFEAGHLDASSTAYRFNYTALGVPIDTRSRRAYAEALEAAEIDSTERALPDPFDTAEAAAFADWLGSPSPADSETRISRYVRALYDERPDVAARFHDLSGPGRAELLTWVRDHGRENAEVLPEYAPRPVAPARPRPADLPVGVNLVGYLRAEDGIGNVARSVLDVLGRAGSAVSLHTCTATGSRQRADVDSALDSPVTYDTTIACVNADAFPVLNEQMQGRMPVAASTVGLWAWHVDVFPEWMARSAALVDEVWVHSRHAAAAVAAECNVPVHVFPPPVVVPDRVGEIDRTALGLTDEFTFLCCFDFAAGFERKNPLAVVHAFRRAFAPHEGPRLLVKSVNGGNVTSGVGARRRGGGGPPGYRDT